MSTRIDRRRLATAWAQAFILAAGALTLVAARPAGAATPAQLTKLGLAFFTDTSLSNPRGVSCATCHSPQAGWTNGNSSINQLYGPVPGAVPGRFGSRRPPTIGYGAFLTQGPPTPVAAFGGLYAGGYFYDGRAASLTAQAAFPMQGPNEMNNTPAGVAEAVSCGPNAWLFQQTFGVPARALPATTVFNDVIEAIVAFESSQSVSPFTSQYDEYLDGKYKMTPSQLAGLQLFTGTWNGRPGGPPATKNANCSVCHALSFTPGQTPDFFTASTFHNTGVPRNPANPYYHQTNPNADPTGYNPLGSAYIDYGLGDFLYPVVSLPSGNVGPGNNGLGDLLKINGLFKTPTLRNVDARPYPNFVKCYGHNGYFKSLAQIVHFYNTRNLTTCPGEVINFTAANPYANLKGQPLWPAPEMLSAATLINPAGTPGAQGGLVGNLGLTPQDEANLVAFMQTLTDAPQ